MNKLTAEKCKEFFEQWFRGVEAGDDPEWREPEYQSREWHEYISRRQLALGAWSAALELSHTVPALKPIEPPTTTCAGWVKEAVQEHDDKWKQSIRAAGYEVTK